MKLFRRRATPPPASDVKGLSAAEQRHKFEAEQRREAARVQAVLDGIGRVMETDGVVSVQWQESTSDSAPTTWAVVINTQATIETALRSVRSIDSADRLFAKFERLFTTYNFDAPQEVDLGHIKKVFDGVGLTQYFMWKEAFSADDPDCRWLAMTLGRIVRKRRSDLKTSWYISALVWQVLQDYPNWNAALQEVVISILRDEFQKWMQISHEKLVEDFAIFASFPHFPVDRMAQEMVDHIWDMFRSSSSEVSILAQTHAKLLWNLFAHSNPLILKAMTSMLHRKIETSLKKEGDAFKTIMASFCHQIAEKGDVWYIEG